MLKRLRIENFMAHADTDIEFAPGVTVITGPNNTGKSAVVEALRCVVTNPAPKHFIRHGAKQARVELELADGTKIAWIRKGRYAMYEVQRPGEEEPQTYAKFGRTPPGDVLELLGLSPVLLEDSGAVVDVHLGDQRSPIFLLDQPGTVLAGFFAASSEAAHLLSMQQLLRTRVVRARQEKNAMQERVGSIDASLDRLAPLPDLALQLEDAREAAAAIGCAEQELPRLQTTAARLRSDHAARIAARASLDVLQPLASAPPLADTAVLHTLLQTGARLRSASGRARAEHAALAPLAPAPALLETRSLSAAVRDLDRLAGNKQRAERNAEAIKHLIPPPSVHATAELADYIGSLKALTLRKKNITQAQQKISGLTPPPAPVPMREFGDLLTSLSHAAKRVAAARSVLQTLEQEMDVAHERISRRIGQIGACPLCGNALDAASFLNGDHAHDNGEDGS